MNYHMIHMNHIISEQNSNNKIKIIRRNKNISLLLLLNSNINRSRINNIQIILGIDNLSKY